MAIDKTIRRKRGPRRHSQSEYRRVGIECIDKDRLWFRGLTCGCRWSPNLLRGGRLPRGYWKCPEYECNCV